MAGMKFIVAVLVVIIIGLTAGLAYFAGKSSGLSSNKEISPKVLTPTVKPAAGETITPQPTASAIKKVSGGGILSFPKYELTIPDDWDASRQIPGPDSEKVILKKNGYEISILQGAFGGGMCLYPGDPDFEGPSSRYEQFVDITTKSGDLLRRSWTGGGGFAICQKTQYGWGAPTLFGAFSVKTPTAYTPAMIGEIDGILASITRV